MKELVDYWELNIKKLAHFVGALNKIIEVDKDILSIDVDFEEIIKKVLDGLKEITGSFFCQFWIPRGNVLHLFKSTQKCDEEFEIEIKGSFVELAIEKKSRIYIPDIGENSLKEYMWFEKMSCEIAMKSRLFIPIFTPTSDKVFLGVLISESPELNGYNEDVQLIAERFAIQVGVAIHNMHFREGLKLAIEIAKAIRVDDKNPKNAIREILSKIARYFGQSVNVQFLSVEKNKTRLVVECSTAQETESSMVLIDSSFCGMVYRTKKTIRSNNVVRDYKDQFKDTIGGSGIKEPTKSELAAPIKNNGEILGILNIESPFYDAFTEFDEYFISIIAAQSEIWVGYGEDWDAKIAKEGLESARQAIKHLKHIIGNSTVSMSSDMAKLQKNINKDAEKYLLNINNQFKVLNERIDDFDKRYTADYSKMETVCVNDVAKEMVLEVITRSDIDVSFDDLDEELTSIRIYTHFKEIFWNLLSNSQKAIKEGSDGKIDIGTKLHIGKYTNEVEGFTIWVRDNGIGIPIDIREKVYDISYSTKSGGFGLYFVKNYVDRCGGEIKISDGIDGGTEFKIFFPLNKDYVNI